MENEDQEIEALGAEVAQIMIGAAEWAAREFAEHHLSAGTRLVLPLLVKRRTGLKLVAAIRRNLGVEPEFVSQSTVEIHSVTAYVDGYAVDNPNRLIGNTSVGYVVGRGELELDAKGEKLRTMINKTLMTAECGGFKTKTFEI